MKHTLPFHETMLLLTSQTAGILWATLLFALSFMLVHLAKLVSVGWKAQKTPPPTPKEEEKQPTPKPVYYIVERKRRKPGAGYTEPKRITFKSSNDR